MLVGLLTSCGGPDEEASTTDPLIDEVWGDNGGGGGSGGGSCTTDWTCGGSDGCAEYEVHCVEVECCDGGSCGETGNSGCFDPALVPGPSTRPIRR